MLGIYIYNVWDLYNMSIDVFIKLLFNCFMLIFFPPKVQKLLLLNLGRLGMCIMYFNVTFK